MNEPEGGMIDAPFMPDPDADQELGATDLETIADQDLKGSRLLVVRRAIEPIDLDGTPGGVVQFACTFQPAPETRFTLAQFRLRLVMPDGVQIVDLAPRSISDPSPVEFTLTRKGKLGLSGVTGPVKPEVELGSSKKFVRYHCQVQGAGEGTNLARWDFRENPDRQDGIGPEQVLALTLPVTGPVTGGVIVSARLARAGLRGRVAAFRDLILGAGTKQQSYMINFEIPEAPATDRLEPFFRVTDADV